MKNSDHENHLYSISPRELVNKIDGKVEKIKTTVHNFSEKHPMIGYAGNFALAFIPFCSEYAAKRIPIPERAAFMSERGDYQILAASSFRYGASLLFYHINPLLAPAVYIFASGPFITAMAAKIKKD